MARGHCIKTISGEQALVDDAHPILDPVSGEMLTWWDLRPMMIQIPYFEYLRLKAWIVKECKTSGACDKRITSWDRTLEDVGNIVIQK